MRDKLSKTKTAARHKYYTNHRLRDEAYTKKGLLIAISTSLYKVGQ